MCEGERLQKPRHLLTCDGHVSLRKRLDWGGLLPRAVRGQDLLW
eukprot:COSAG03_NODE_24725_length_270_cov_0.888889_1_plen_43_part_01